MTAAAVGSGPRAGAYAYDSVAKAAPVSPQVTFLIRPAHIYDAHVHDVAAGVGTRDTLFAAEETGLGLAEQSATLRAASAGKGNFGLGSASQADANVLGRAWVGDGYQVASDGKTLISSNGMRQFRPASWKPNLGRAQANFEQRFEGQLSTQWQGNGHLDISDWP
jgi:hypothetical protein